MDKTPKVFVSYSWDSSEHKEWVTSFVNILRQNGVNATSDVFETQRNTVNLNTMMVTNIKNSDFTIVVLTPTYAEKADELQGGVGFETGMLISFIQENMKKIIPILRIKENGRKSIPFYLTGVHYIDFSDETKFEEKFKELLHKIYAVDLVEKSPLGQKPDLRSQKTKSLNQMAFKDLNELIPNFQQITDLDKNRFMQQSFEQIRDGLIILMDNTKEKNANFDFDHENITTRKTIYRMYINGSQKHAVKLWLGNTWGYGVDTINLAYGNYVSDNDGSMNEIITCEVDKDKTLILKMTMNMFGKENANTSATILTEIWKNVIRWLL